MDKNEINRLVKNIKLKLKITTIALIIAILLTLLIESQIKYLIIAILIIIGFVLHIKFSNTTNILFNKCNPNLYYAVTTGVSKQVPLEKQILVAEFIGDYSSAIEIANAQLVNAKSNIVKIGYIERIISNAFLANDYDLCKKSIDDFIELSKNTKINAYINKRNEFYLAYINADYEIAKRLLGEVDELAKRQTNSFKCNMLYFNALVDYSLGDMDSAKIKFKMIAESYPNMYLANVSTKYLDSYRKQYSRRNNKACQNRTATKRNHSKNI